MYDLSKNEHSQLITWLSSLKNCDDEELMIYYEKCLRYLKNREGKNQTIGKKDLTYYVFLTRDYIESIFNDTDCTAYEEEIRQLEVYDLYTDDFDADDFNLLRFVLDDKVREVLDNEENK